MVIEDFDECISPTGCLCRPLTDAKLVKDKICSLVKDCPSAPCTTPIMMEGFCCPICGKILYSF